MTNRCALDPAQSFELPRDPYSNLLKLLFEGPEQSLEAVSFEPQTALQRNQTQRTVNISSLRCPHRTGAPRTACHEPNGLVQISPGHQLSYRAERQHQMPNSFPANENGRPGDDDCLQWSFRLHTGDRRTPSAVMFTQKDLRLGHSHRIISHSTIWPIRS